MVLKLFSFGNIPIQLNSEDLVFLKKQSSNFASKSSSSKFTGGIPRTFASDEYTANPGGGRDITDGVDFSGPRYDWANP